MKEVLHNIAQTSGFMSSHRIGRGSFGTVYLAKNGNKTFALKLENTKKISSPQLNTEHAVYAALQGCPGIPKLYYYGTNRDYSFLVTQLLDYSLSDIFERRGCFSPKTIAMLGKRLLRILECLHNECYLYRDMKPENVMVCGANIFLVDFGMCKKYINENSHIPMKTGKVLTGTARYASRNTHEGVEQARRDDIEGLCYVLAFLARGDLPWMRIPAPTRKEKYAKIGEVKGKIRASDLCSPISGGEHLARIIQYSQNLGFEERPDYDFVSSMFDAMLKDHNETDDGVFDWCPKEVKRKGFVEKLKRMFSLCGSSKAKSYTK